MHMLRLNKKWWLQIALTLIFSCFSFSSFASSVELDDASIDRVQVVMQQINLLKSRLHQVSSELTSLQHEHDENISQLTIEKVGKNLLDKATLDVAVSKSNLDSVNIELADSQQTINWLEKNIQEIENQLNVLGIFGLKAAPNEMATIQEYRSDLEYQQKLLQLEKVRARYLQDIQSTAISVLQLKNEKYSTITALLKSRKILHIKQQQVKDELAYQEQQNHWLEQLNVLYKKIAKVDPEKAHTAYSELERDIFYANESANYAYIQSLIARYVDQIQQMKLTIMKSNSISLLNEIGNQVQTLTKQVTKLDNVTKSRVAMLEKHVTYLSQKKAPVGDVESYLNKLKGLEVKYKASDVQLVQLDDSLVAFRKTLDHALQVELSSRQGLPTFGFRTLLDLGKEMLLVPALTFQITKSLSSNLLKTFQTTSLFTWSLFAASEVLLLLVLFFLNKLLTQLIKRPSQWREKPNSKWLSLQCLKRNFIDLSIIGNIIGVFYFFNVPMQNYSFVIYLASVWLVFKCIVTISRVALVETTHDTTGHDVRLYKRLRWIIWLGGIITATTVFVHLLPLIYELKTLCDRLFLFLLMIVSILLLRSWDVVPNLILSHMESQHPYLRRSVSLIGILIPILLFGNAVIGLFGFVNLIMTVSWYEGVFMIVLIGYLLLRGLLSDGMEQLSRLVIQYVNNGWLWTEAFLKPIDTILRISLFFMSWAVLFLIYGWDKQSPIVERLTGLLHYQLLNVLKTTITPINTIELLVVISIFYWTAKWTREFVYRLLSTRTKDMGIKNSIAILSQYSVIVLGATICLRVLGINFQALLAVFGIFAFGIGWGLRDLANNFACGFLILLERPLRVGDIVNINGVEGDVTHIGSRAVTVRTWDHMELLVPNAEIFNKSFTNWTAKDNNVRTVLNIKINRHDNPHEIKTLIQDVLADHKEVLKDPVPEVFLREMSDILMNFEIRYFVNIRQVKSRVSVSSSVHLAIWDKFMEHGIKPPYPQQEIFLRSDKPELSFQNQGLASVVTDFSSAR